MSSSGQTSTSLALIKTKPIVTNTGETKLVPINHPGDQSGKKPGDGYKDKDPKVIAMKKALADAGLKPSLDGQFYCLDCPGSKSYKNIFTVHRYMLGTASLNLKQRWDDNKLIWR